MAHPHASTKYHKTTPWAFDKKLFRKLSSVVKNIGGKQQLYGSICLWYGGYGHKNNTEI